VDEVLAVGDAEFQRKCLGKMSEVRRQGRTVLFVSHNMMAVESLCTRAIVLKAGRCCFDGNQVDSIRYYHKSYEHTHGEGRYVSDGRAQRDGASMATIRHADITSRNQQLLGQFPIGAPLEFSLECISQHPVSPPEVGIGIHNDMGQRVVTLHTQCDNTLRLVGISSTRFVYKCSVSGLALAPGQYFVLLALAYGGVSHERIENAMTFTILPTDFFQNGGKTARGEVLIPQSWEIDCAT
jgi:lipopolysaccharide transport system ATP-binding protein